MIVALAALALAAVGDHDRHTGRIGTRRRMVARPPAPVQRGAPFRRRPVDVLVSR